MDVPALSFSQVAMLVVGAHAAGVTHGAALEARHSAAPAPAAMPAEAVEAVTTAAEETPAAFVIGGLYWSAPGRGLVWYDTETMAPEGCVLLCQVWHVTGKDGTVHYWPGWENEAVNVSWTPAEEATS